MSSRYGIRSIKSRGSRIKRLLEHSPDSCCPICGKKINIELEELSPDHVVPRFVAKWSLNISDEQKEELISLLGARDNILIVHRRCNFSKGSTIPDIDALHITDTAKQNLHSLVDKVSFAIQDSQSVMNTILRRQEYRCGRCHRKLNMNNATLRRRHRNSRRTIGNAICLCPRCNWAY